MNKTAAAVPGIESGKNEKVEKERARLMELFNNADENKLDFIRDAVQQVAWLGVTIMELQAEIDKNGPVVPFQNGRNQSGLQANPACKTLKDFQTLYNTQFRALLPVLPEKCIPGKLDEFMSDYRKEADKLFPCDDLTSDTENV